MKTLHNNQKGFGAVEVVLVLIIIILIGVVGWMVYKNHHKTTTSTKSSSAITHTTSSPPSQPANISATDASQLVTDFYTKYKACDGDGTCQTNLVKQDGTTNLYAYYKPTTGTYGEDPIMCSQSLPDSIGGVSDLATTSTTASGTIATIYTGAASGKIKFTIVKDSGSLKIDTITCDPALHPSTVGA